MATTETAKDESKGKGKSSAANGGARRMKKVQAAWAEKLKPGDTMEGRYLGCRTLATRFGARTKHFLADDAGAEMSVIGTSELNAKLQVVPLGAFVRMTRGERVVGSDGVARVSWDVECEDGSHFGQEGVKGRE